eukprot:1157009-Pelagomonas_calceolata.AAC.2
MSFYSRQLLSNPTLRTFWQAAYLPSLKRHDLKKHDVVQAGDKIAEVSRAYVTSFMPRHSRASTC